MGKLGGSRPNFGRSRVPLFRYGAPHHLQPPHSLTPCARLRWPPSGAAPPANRCRVFVDDFYIVEYNRQYKAIMTYYTRQNTLIFVEYNRHEATGNAKGISYES